MADNAPGADTGTTATITLRLPPSAVHVRTARLVAAAMARRSGVDEALLDEVRLAVGEACARAVRLHERHGLTAPVTVEFVDGDRFVVAVLDAAPPDTSTEADTDADGSTLPDPAGKTAQQLDGQVSGASRHRNGASVGTSQLAPWADPTGDALGLALLGAVVQDLSVQTAPDGDGSRVVMTWPLV